MFPKFKPVKLESWQVEWATRCSQILKQSYIYVDNSRLGSGKSIIAMWVAQQLNEPLIIICPKILIAKWENELAKYNMSNRLLAIINYESLRGSRGNQLKNGILTREDIPRAGGGHKTIFKPTPQYEILIKNGALVIFDEFHKVKNDTTTHKAFRAMVRAITSREKCPSRIGLLSASPLDKDEHIVNLLKGIGYIAKKQLFHTDPHTKIINLEGHGLQELIDSCDQIDEAATSKILEEANLIGVRYYRHDGNGNYIENINIIGKYSKRDELNQLCLMLYSGVIKPTIAGSMLPEMTDEKYIHSTHNSFYVTDEFVTQQINDAINPLAKLAEAATINDDDENQTKGSRIKGIRNIINNIEASKLGIFFDATVKILNDDPNAKVIVAFNGVDNIERLTKALSIYGALAIYGKIQNGRHEIIELFNSDKRHRVLIMNPEITGFGVDLHDTVGDSPRTLLISPCYNFITLYQTTGRINRRGVKSNTTVKIVYCSGEASREVKIRAALTKKSEVMKRMIDDRSLDYITLPDEYESETIDLSAF